MLPSLDQLAEAYGIELSYASESGDRRVIKDEVKRALLASFGVNANATADIARAIAKKGAAATGKNLGRTKCFVPAWLQHGRCWGIVCQLYALRSSRNLGIGDFADLAALCEIGAAVGADFVGTNPLHALFLSEPERCSPYAPSSRRFINPLYIAVDQITGTEQALAELPLTKVNALREANLIDYAGVARLKRTLLRRLFQAGGRSRDFRRFREAGGRDLENFATFEALSDAMRKRGHGSGWHTWPKQYRDNTSRAVSAFAKRNATEVAFHAWLQWLCAEQLASAQARARDAGMRIGLYLDFAVAVAPDGAATWSDPWLAVASARVGAPPDTFNAEGQDWGLAPLSPAALREADCEPFAKDLAAVMRHAGAIRIDHAMGLQRLYWIPAGLDATAGSYVRYPLEAMLHALSRCSRAHRAVVVGEDLGTVPEGFRDRMRRAEIQSYRLCLFERYPDGTFILPSAYPRQAMACFATHDLPPLAGWWCGHDIKVRERLGLVGKTAAMRRQRKQDRGALIRALLNAGVARGRLRTFVNARGRLPDDVAIASHRFLASTQSRLMGAQIEDLVGAVEQVNVPGTHLQYPNWRRPLRVRLEDLPQCPLFRRITTAVARERPRR